MLRNEAYGPYEVSQASCKANAANWRVCAANAAERWDLAEMEYCEAKAQKIAGWLEDLIEEGGY